MAELLGNIVLMVVFIVAAKAMMGNNKSVTEKARTTLQSIDNSLATQSAAKYRHNHPEEFCTSTDYLKLAALAVHPNNREARKDLELSKEQANNLRKKLLRELAEH